MTISTILTIKQFSGNDLATAFAFPYKFIETSDLVVILTNAAGADVTQILGTNYTVSGEGTDANGIVTMGIAPATGEILTIYRDVVEDQDTDLTNQKSVFLSRIEAALDYSRMIDQQHQEELDRCVRNTITEGPTSLSPADWLALADFSGYDSLVVGNMALLLAVNTSAVVDVKMLGFYAVGDGGGGHFRYNASGLESTHNGGTIISPQTVVSPGAIGWWTAPTTGTDGVWERIGDKLEINVAWFGFATTSIAARNRDAFMEAHDAISGDGGTLSIPKGDFAIDPELDITKHNLTIKGAGSGYGYAQSLAATKLIFTAGTYGLDLTTPIGGTPTQSQANYASVRDILFEGDDVCEIGIAIIGAMLLDRVSCEGFTSVGCRIIDYGNQTQMKNCSFSYNNLAATTIGLMISSVAVPGSTTISEAIGCNMRANGVGLYIDSGSYLHFQGCVIESNISHGLHIYNKTSVIFKTKFDNCWFENNTTADATGFQIVVESDKSPNPDVSNLEMDHCSIQCLGTKRNIWIKNLQYGLFRHCSIGGGDTVGGIQLDAGAQYVHFEIDRVDHSEPASYQGGGFRKWKRTGLAGFTTNMRSFFEGVSSDTLVFAQETIVAGTPVEGLPSNYDVGALASFYYPLFGSGLIMGVASYRLNATVKGNIGFRPVFSPEYSGSINDYREDLVGTHDGGAGDAILTDTSQSWAVNELVGYAIFNVTDESEGPIAGITSNTATTVTAALADGSVNNWQIGDEYVICESFLPEGESKVKTEYALDDYVSALSTCIGVILYTSSAYDGGASDNMLICLGIQN